MQCPDTTFFGVFTKPFKPLFPFFADTNGVLPVSSIAMLFSRPRTSSNIDEINIGFDTRLLCRGPVGLLSAHIAARAVLSLRGRRMALPGHCRRRPGGAEGTPLSGALHRHSGAARRRVLPSRAGCRNL